MKTLSLIFSFLAVILFSSCELFEEEPILIDGGVITGVVMDKLTGQTIQGADVSVTGQEAGQTVTGSQGIYRFEDIDPGEYTVVVSKIGYKANTAITVVEPGKATNGQVNLEPYTTLIASTYILDFGASQVDKSFSVFNPLGQSVSVAIQTSRDWIRVTPAQSADIPTGRDFPFSVSIDRDLMPQTGVNEGSLTIQTTNNGAPVIKIVAIK